MEKQDIIKQFLAFVDLEKKPISTFKTIYDDILTKEMFGGNTASKTFMAFHLNLLHNLYVAKDYIVDSFTPESTEQIRLATAAEEFCKFLLSVIHKICQDHEKDLAKWLKKHNKKVSLS